MIANQTGKAMRNKLGFTLVEIMIVVAIIGLLATIAIPSFIKARESSQKNACINNLRQIGNAKSIWAIEHGTLGSTTPDIDDIVPYIKNGYPECPSKGSYTLNPVGSDPICSWADKYEHILPR